MTRRTVTAPFVQWSIRVSRADIDSFRALLPIHGSASWFMATALSTFLDVCEHNDATQYAVHQRIQRYLHDGESRGAVERLAVNLNTDLYTRFNNLFPEKGAASWFVRHIVAAIVPELQAIALEERVEAAVRNVLTGIQGA